MTNVPPAARQPYVGASAFAHKAGLHASAIKVDPDLYQHMDPVGVGNDMRLLVSDMAGRASIELKGRELGYDLSGDRDLVDRVTARVKELEARGYTFEAADASFELLLAEEADGRRPRYFEVESWRVITETLTHARPGEEAVSEATVKLVAEGVRYVETGEGNGPVNALDQALRQALVQAFPVVAKFELIDYKVRILDQGHGTDAITRVLIETSDGEVSWVTVGVGHNVIEASWEALLDGITFGLRRLPDSYRQVRIAAIVFGAVSQLHDLTALEQGDAVRRGEVSPRELAAHYLDRVRRRRRLRDRAPPSSLSSGPRRCCRSPRRRPAVRRPYRDQGPQPHGRRADDVRLGGVRRLRARRLRRVTLSIEAAGLVSLGKTNTPEFGSPCYTEPDVAPPAVTPWDRDPDGRRLVRRCRRGGVGRAGGRGAGLRRWWVDPDPGIVLRAGRAEADARPGQRLADVRRGHRPRHRRLAGTHGPRRCRPARRPGRPACRRPVLGACAVLVVPSRLRP